MDKKDVEELIKVHDKKIDAEVEKIEKSEKKIEDEESQIIQSEKKIIETIKRRPFSAYFIQPGTTAKEFGFFRKMLINKFSRKQRLLFALIVTFAVVLVWRGMWVLVDDIPILSIAIVSLFVGVVILWFLQRFTDLK